MLHNRAGQEVSDDSAKAQVLFDHFSHSLGDPGPSNLALNWDNLQLPTADLSNLDVLFSLDELKAAVFELHTEKAPGPDGFIGAFYRSCWDIISLDLLVAVNQMMMLKGTIGTC